MFILIGLISILLFILSANGVEIPMVAWAFNWSLLGIAFLSNILKVKNDKDKNN